MSAKFFDIYIRPAGTKLTDFVLDPNTLNGWDRLELLDEKAKVFVEPKLKACGDGTDIVDGEMISVECGTMRVEKTEYDYLRSTFHNKKCDVLMYDPQDDTFMIAIWGVKLAVTKMVESGSTIVIKIAGKKEYAVGAVNPWLLGSNTPSCLISGTVYKKDGTTPLAGATVNWECAALSVSITDVTDKDGKYLIQSLSRVYNLKNSGVVSATKAGGWIFTSIPSFEITQNGEYIVDIVATTDGA